MRFRGWNVASFIYKELISAGCLCVLGYDITYTVNNGLLPGALDAVWSDEAPTEIISHGEALSNGSLHIVNI